MNKIISLHVWVLSIELKFTKLLLVIIDVRAKCGGGRGRKYNLKVVLYKLLRM